MIRVKHGYCFMVNLHPPTPAKNRAMHIPAKELVPPHPAWEAASNIPLATNMGLLPLISEKGASSIGAMANPIQNIVIPSSTTTGLMFHFSCNAPLAALYEPEAIAAMAVAMAQMMVTANFRVLFQRKGDSYFFRLGKAKSGGGREANGGTSVSNVR